MPAGTGGSKRGDHRCRNFNRGQVYRDDDHPRILFARIPFHVGTYSIHRGSHRFPKDDQDGNFGQHQSDGANRHRADGRSTLRHNPSWSKRQVSLAIATDDATMRSEIMSTRSIADLPLNGRDPLQLARMTAGSSSRAWKSSTTGIPPEREDFNGAGTREIQNSLSHLDGISIVNNLITTTPTRPMTTDAISEVEIQTGTYPAQYGSYMGVHINMVTKSGTNAFHGALLEFLRNPGFGCQRSFFTLPTPANPTAAKPPLRQNQFRFRTGWSGGDSETV